MTIPESLSFKWEKIARSHSELPYDCRIKKLNKGKKVNLQLDLFSP